MESVIISFDFMESCLHCRSDLSVQLMRNQWKKKSTRYVHTSGVE